MNSDPSALRDAPAYERHVRPRRPAAFDIFGEFRFMLESATLALRIGAITRVPVGPELRRTVLLIPGFMAGDLTLAPLARYLRRLGHRAIFAGIWMNSDCPRATSERLGNRLRHAHREHGEPVVIIGHSLGGIYARELAHEFPEMVERAITMGSPVSQPRASCHPAVLRMANLMAAWRGRRSGCLTEACACGIRLTREEPPGVAVTAIYSRSDGIVHWESCIDRLAPDSVEHVEVGGSHCGMAVSSEVYRVIADRLALPRPRRAPILRLLAAPAVAR